MLMMMAAFAVLAWFGSLIDNLLLTYVIGQQISLLFFFSTVPVNYYHIVHSSTDV